MKLINFITEANIKFNGKFDYSKCVYKTNKTKLIIICPIHGEFYQTSSSHLKSSHGCRKCAIDSTAKQKSYTINDFISIASKNHKNKYDYSLVIFNKLSDYVNIICPIHGQFSQRAKIHLNSGCMKCRNDKHRNSLQSIIDRANLIHKNKYDYSKFTNHISTKIKINIICKIHGSFLIRINNHLKGQGCPKCSRDNNRKKYYDHFIKKSNNIHNNFYDYSLIIPSKLLTSSSANIICPIHGKFKQRAEIHANGSNCPKCVKDNRRLSFDDFIIKAKQVHKNKYDYSESDVKYVYNKIKIICYKHGPFYQRVSAHLYNKSGCPHCSKIISKEETNWLDYLKLPNEYRNKPLNVNGKIFFPDAYDPATKTIYEFYGDYWHGNLSVYKPNSINKLNKMKFIDLYNRTINRENILKQSGYNVVTIWESDWKKINSGQI